MADERRSVAVIDLGPHSHDGRNTRADDGALRAGDARSAENTRSAGSDAKHSAALRKMGRRSLLEWTIRRLSDCSLLDQVVVTGPAEYSEALRDQAIHPAAWLPSAEPTQLGRFAEIVTQTQADWLVIAGPNRPFADPMLIDRLLAAAWASSSSDLVSFASESQSPSSLSHLGMLADVCNARAIERLSRSTTLSGESRDVIQLAHSLPGMFTSRYLPLPKPLQREDIRLTLENDDDWERAHMIIEAASEDSDFRELVELARRCDLVRCQRPA